MHHAHPLGRDFYRKPGKVWESMGKEWGRIGGDRKRSVNFIEPISFTRDFKITKGSLQNDPWNVQGAPKDSNIWGFELSLLDFFSGSWCLSTKWLAPVAGTYSPLQSELAQGSRGWAIPICRNTLLMPIPGPLQNAPCPPSRGELEGGSMN